MSFRHNRNFKQPHTSLPWQNISVYVMGNDGLQVSFVECRDAMNDQQDKANAEFIVRACNAHYDFIEMLKKARNIYHCHGVNPAEIDELLAKHGVTK